MWVPIQVWDQKKVSDWQMPSPYMEAGTSYQPETSVVCKGNQKT